MMEVLIPASAPQKLLFRISLTVVLEEIELLVLGWASRGPGWSPGPAASPRRDVSTMGIRFFLGPVG